jgi:hypothetical protein
VVGYVRCVRGLTPTARDCYATRVEQTHVELIVQMTARVSAAAFAAALILFALSGRDRQRGARRGVRLFMAFILAHSIHFCAVIGLAAVTGQENIRARGGWLVALTIAGLFYLSSFAILQAWRRVGSGRSMSSAARRAAHIGVAFIAVVFLTSYIARAATLPIYWLPTIGMIGTVAAFFLRARRIVAPSIGSSKAASQLR